MIISNFTIHHNSCIILNMLFIFDMGGVVTTTFKIDSLFKKLNTNKEDFNQICSGFDKDIFHELELGKITSEQFWNEFNKRIGKLQRGALDGFIQIGKQIHLSTDINFQDIQTADTDLFRLYFHPEENPKTIELINLLKKKHRVICGTNTIQSHWENHLERGDYAHFHQTYASNKIGYAKPDKKFFEVIMEAEGYSPEETYFTDDKLENCEAARAVGINAEQFTTADELFEKWSKL